jgi:SAM-dependent methyltransferase
MNKEGDYDRIFAQRSSDYDLAMQQFPNARNREFERLFDHVDLSKIKNLADIPSGGGYLGKFLPSTCKIEAYEPCSDFNANQAHTFDVGLDDIVLPKQSFDAVVCLAAIHHVHNKAKFVSNLYRAVKPAGYLLIADVFAENPIGEFLDHFAGKHNGTGHDGVYIGEDAIRNIITPLGASIINIEQKACHWQFGSEQEMLDFCRLLFGLRNVSDIQLRGALDEYVKVSISEHTVSLEWELIYHTIQKPA